MTVITDKSSSIGNVTLIAMTGITILVPYYYVKSLQLISRSGTRRFNLRVPDLQISCRDLTTWQGTRPNNGSQAACSIVTHWFSKAAFSSSRCCVLLSMAWSWVRKDSLVPCKLAFSLESRAVSYWCSWSSVMIFFFSSSRSYSNGVRHWRLNKMAVILQPPFQMHFL